MTSVDGASSSNETKDPAKFAILLSKVKNLKEIKGPVGIREVSFDSRCIVIENMSDKSDFDVSGWYLERTFEGENDDHTRNIKVTLPDGSFLERRSRLNLWAGYVDNVNEDFKSDILYRHLTDWGTGNVQITRLYDRDNHLKATHTKNVIF